MRSYLGLTVSLAIACPSSVSAQVDNVPIASVSQPQTLKTADGTIRYDAGWRSIPLKDAAGVPEATISLLSYVRTDGANRANRPVVFAFNGGPGAASSALAFGLLGPKSRRSSTPGGSVYGDADGMADNPDTVLSVADLVLIDPVGTGFSRELRPGGGKPYWSLNGDAKATETAIRAWLAAEGRTSSPIYILGESYGGFRAAAISKDLADLDLRGLVFVSPGVNLGPSDDAATIAAFPTYVMTAAAQRVVGVQGRTPTQVYEGARRFALDELAPALEMGTLLPADRRRALAARMASMTGIPAARYDAANLRLDTQSFLEQLKPGMIVGRIDTRIVAPVPKREAVPGRIAAANDPALAMGASNVKKSPAVAAYLRGLGVKSDLDYVSLTLDVNFGWDWTWRSASGEVEDNVRVNAAPNLARLMKAKPQTRVLLVGGYYDLAIPWLQQQYDLTHAGVPADRLTMTAFAAGHTLYADAQVRAQLSQQLRAFIGATAAQ